MKNLNYKPYPVCYTPMDSSLLGRIWIAARESGVVFLDFSESEAGFIAILSEYLENFKGEPQLRLDPTSLSPYLETLNAYFDHKTPIPGDFPLETACLTDFQCDVLKLVQAIPFGTVATYGDLADKLSNPNASRAVGQVLRRNPLPIIIPCHRIVKAGGNIGGYGGILGSERKVALLKHEGVILA
ncbi:MAG: methylated-DNA--[protein]-cysteine S-methyltransferase [Chloroflexota bacterium]